MGRATILSGGADGLYMARLDFGVTERDARVVALTTRIGELTAQIAAWQETLDAFKVAEEAPAAAAVDAAIAEYVAAAAAGASSDVLKIKAAAHGKALQALFDVRARYALLALQLNDMTLDRAQAQRDRAALETFVLEQERLVWCADVTEDATGDRATIEIPGEYGNDERMLVIAPGAPVPTADHGQLVAREMQSGPQAYFNAAILPGWQRHMPTYRAGTLTAVNRVANTADVDLDDMRSSAQALNINAAPTLSGVPIEYMTCNAAAFEVGDRVIVELQDRQWDQPRIIGFIDNPRRCDRIVLTRRCSNVVETDLGPVGIPFESEWMAFNAADGTVTHWGSRAVDAFTDPTHYWANENGMFWRGKAWAERSGTSPGVPTVLDANDGEVFISPGDYWSYSVDGAEIVAVFQTSGSSARIDVFNAQTFEIERSLTPRIIPLRIKARAGWAVTSGNYDGWWMRLIDHVHDVNVGQVLYVGDVVLDVAISTRYLAVLVMDLAFNIARIELYARADIVPDDLGNYPPLVPCDTLTLPGNGNGYEALSMTDKHIVAVQNLSAFANSFVRVHSIVDDAMTFIGQHYPWQIGCDSASVWAGN